MQPIVTCACGQKNRIPPTWHPQATARCGSCKRELNAVVIREAMPRDDDEDYSDFDDNDYEEDHAR